VRWWAGQDFVEEVEDHSCFVILHDKGLVTLPKQPNVIVPATRIGMGMEEGCRRVTLFDP
jgi:hypothetical protein